MKEQKAISFIFAISASISLLSGISANFFLKVDPTDSTLIGLLLFVICELLTIVVMANSIRHKVASIPQISSDSAHNRNALSFVDSFCRYLESSDPFSVYVATLFVHRKRGLHSFSPSEGIEIPREDVAKTWTDCIAHADTSIVAMSYVDPGFWWDKAYAEPNIVIRKAKAAQGNTVWTCFLWQQESEVPTLAKHANTLRSEGSTVLIGSREALVNDHNCNTKLDRIGTLDFGIIDGSWAFLHFLNDDRLTTHALITANKDIVQACKDIVKFANGSACIACDTEDA